MSELRDGRMHLRNSGVGLNRSSNFCSILNKDFVMNLWGFVVIGKKIGIYFGYTVCTVFTLILWPHNTLLYLS